ncbi:MAG: ATP-binding protein [Bdellovibrionales bacterium]|nr:ATP-binding protein [Bdellovibrionales bacterium]
MVSSAAENPFRVSQLESLPFLFLSGTRETLLAKFAHHDCRGAIVGPHGSGKTTLLEELFQHFSVLGDEVCLVRLNDQKRCLSEDEREAISLADTILLDGAEQFSVISWRWFLLRLRKNQRLIITTHQEGWLPTVYECRTTPELFYDIVRKLDPTRISSASSCADLLARHHGNIRQALFTLYDEHCSR